MALQTIAPEHRDPLRISIHVPHCSPRRRGVDVRKLIGERAFGQWLELDRLLVRFWESHSIRPTVISTTPEEEKEKDDVRGCIECLLPEATKRGITDLVEHYVPQ